MAIKVLQLCAVDFTLDKFLAPFCFYLKDQGYEVTVACTESVFMQPLRERGLCCKDLPIARSTNIFSHWKSYRQLCAWLREEDFDIVHVHTPIAALIGRMAAWRCGVPISIYTAHGFYFHDDMPYLKRHAHIALEQFGGLLDDFLFTQSDEDRQSAIRHHIARENKSRTIGNGIDLTLFDPLRFTSEQRLEKRRELGLTDRNRVLAIIGRLVREKGYFELFHACAKLKDQVPDFRLLVIGDALASDHDDSTQELRTLIKELALEQVVVFAGQRSDVPDCLHAADVFTLPSWREGMPRSVIEAMAMALPVVATNIRGCREEVVHEKTGYLVPPREDEPLRERCEQLLNDPALAQNFGEAGRERALQEFSETSVFEKQIEIYKQLCSEKKR